MGSGDGVRQVTPGVTMTGYAARTPSPVSYRSNVNVKMSRTFGARARRRLDLRVSSKSGSSVEQRPAVDWDFPFSRCVCPGRMWAEIEGGMIAVQPDESSSIGATFLWR